MGLKFTVSVPSRPHPRTHMSSHNCYFLGLHWHFQQLNFSYLVFAITIWWSSGVSPIFFFFFGQNFQQVINWFLPTLFFPPRSTAQDGNKWQNREGQEEVKCLGNTHSWTISLHTVSDWDVIMQFCRCPSSVERIAPVLNLTILVFSFLAKIHTQF